MRIIIYTGKGGVGKTTAAAATALRLSESGKKVLIMSTDQAHSLGDAFDKKIGGEITKIQENLDALEIDTLSENEKSWGHLKSYLKEMLTIKGNGGIEVEELLVFPGLEELFAMFKILDIYEQKSWDVLIVDCAPTGETLSLLKYPEMLSGFMEKILPFKRKSAKIAGPAIEKITKIPMPADNVFDDIEYVMDKMQRLQALLSDKDTLSIRLVTTPEKIVIQETRRTFTCLYLFGYNVDAVIINRIYPARAMEGYFSKWIERQEDGLREIRESFSEIPRFYLELQTQEARAVPQLLALGRQLFRDTDPSAILFKKEIFHLQKEPGCLTIKIFLPFADKGDLDLKQSEEELILSVRNETRRFPLPLECRHQPILSAQYNEVYFVIKFEA
ncbi:ArsA family ATPase [Diplocloster agilis]|uniref:arsenite-transporting ATPase n=1 Tax=Diplocloster agilis TaxID=2850323 RepID=A0A949JWY7_9FIRM|nr:MULTISPECIES: ArsA family ATPase [Lachnospiraceae]MBU9736700.1 ArsA family ATPase [Diplocloster agilis]MCU6734854.1 ArsA family ATPase [Suonthocola fibrivorans]SCJ56409.1 Arsenical pump-driving ATPase [uncultured Clostridium sp.]